MNADHQRDVSAAADALIREIPHRVNARQHGEAQSAAVALADLLPSLRSEPDPSRRLANALRVLAEYDLATRKGPLAAEALVEEARDLVSCAGEALDARTRASLAGVEARLAKVNGRWDDARHDYRRAIDILQAGPSCDVTDLAIMRNNWGDLEEEAGHLSRAKALYDQAIVGVEDPVLRSALLSNRGRVLSGMGRHLEAAAAHREALSLRRRIPRAHGLIAESQGLLATALSKTYAYREAEGAFARAFQMYQQLSHGAENLALLLDNYGMFKLELGQLDTAEAVFEEAGKVLASLSHPPLLHLATFAAHRGALALDRGDFARAHTEYSTAAGLYQAHTPSHPRLAAVHGSMANALMRAGDIDDADALVQRLLSELPDTPDVWHTRAELLSTRSAIRHAQKRYDEAIDDASAVLDDVVQRVGPSSPTVLTVRTNLLFALAGAGRHADALAHADEAERIRDESLDALFSYQTAAERLRTMMEIRESLYGFVTLSLATTPRDANVTRRMFELVLRRQGVAVEAEALAMTAEPVDAETRADVDRLRSILGDLGRRELESNADRAEVSRLRAERDSLERRLAQAFPLAGFVERFRKVTVDDVAAALPPDGALVNFLRFEPIDYGARTGAATRRGPARYLAFVLHSGAPDSLTVTDLGPAEPIETALKAWLELARDPNQVWTKCNLAGKPLTRLVLAPLWPQLEGRRHLVIVADGALARAPFAALPVRGGPLLIDLATVSLADSGRDAASWSHAPRTGGGPPYVAGGIDYGAAPAKSDPLVPRGLAFRILPFDYLGASADEARDVAAVYDVTAEIGSAPSERTLKQLRSPSVLHLATHGFFLERDEAPTVPHPMLRSGLALAGFNLALRGLPMPEDMENGALTAADVLTMSLSKTRLVVLSACDTGLGAVVSNEGVFGLRRAFAVAGADSLVMSLWQVPDYETSMLMVDFHRRVTRGEPLASALRAAQLAIRKTRKHSHYWAAFVLAGRPDAIGPPATPVSEQ